MPIHQRTLLFFLGILMGVNALAQVRISGKINPGKKWGNTLYLGLLEDFEGSFKTLDSVRLDSRGNFLLKSNIPDSGIIFRLLLPPEGGNANFLVEGFADNYIYLPLQPGDHYQIEAEADSLFYSARIVGAREEGIMALREFKRPFYRLAGESYTEMLEKKDSLTVINNRMMSRWQQEIEIYRNNLKDFLLGEEDPSLIILGMYYKYLADFGRYDSAFTRQMLGKTNTSDYSISRRILKRLGEDHLDRTGKILPPVSLKNSEGMTVHLAGIRPKKMVIDFWASWCKPCRLANKGFLSDWQQEMKEKNIRLISISVDRNKEDWIKAIREDGVSWLQLLDDQEKGLAEHLQVYRYPTYLVIGENFKIEFETNNEPELRDYLFGTEN